MGHVCVYDSTELSFLVRSDKIYYVHTRAQKNIFSEFGHSIPDPTGLGVEDPREFRNFQIFTIYERPQLFQKKIFFVEIFFILKI